jgi:hypothetical protein
MTTDNVSQATIAEFGRKYLWWKPVGGQPHSEDRIIAQTMNLGTYDDILLLEQAVGKSRLVESCCTPSRAGSAIAPGSSGAGDYLCHRSCDPGQGSAEVVSCRSAFLRRRRVRSQQRSGADPRWRITGNVT